MIVWLNGTFGAGKTTTARELVPLLPNARVFDPETVGFLLRHVLHEPVDDFQDHPPWRAVVRTTAASILDYVGGTLVAPQTILVEAYAKEIFAGLDIRHFVLHAGDDELSGASMATASRQARGSGGCAISPGTGTRCRGSARLPR